MSKPIFALCVSLGKTTLPLYFEDYDVLLATRAVLVDANIPGVTAEEDSTTRHVFLRPASASQHVRLWVEALTGHASTPVPAKAASAARPARVQRAEETTEGVGRKEETLALMKRPEGVTLEELATRFGILRNSASALPGLAARKYGFEVHKENGRYTAVPKRRAKTRAANKAGGASETRPSLH